MKILHALTTPLILSLFLSTTLATPPAKETSVKKYTGQKHPPKYHSGKHYTAISPPAKPSPTKATSTTSVPQCAASPTSFNSLGYEFAIEVVFPDPEEGPPVYYYPPVRLEPYDVFSGVSVQRPFIGSWDEIHYHFTLTNNKLSRSTGPYPEAVLLPNNLSSFSDGLQSFMFNEPDPGPNLNTSPLNFTIVKVCLPSLDIDQHLRAFNGESEFSV